MTLTLKDFERMERMHKGLEAMEAIVDTVHTRELAALTEQELEQLIHNHLDNIEAIIKAKQHREQDDNS